MGGAGFATANKTNAHMPIRFFFNGTGRPIRTKMASQLFDAGLPINADRCLGQSRVGGWLSARLSASDTERGRAWARMRLIARESEYDRQIGCPAAWPPCCLAAWPIARLAAGCQTARLPSCLAARPAD